MSKPNHRFAAVLAQAPLTFPPPAASGSTTEAMRVIKELTPPGGSAPGVRCVLLQSSRHEYYTGTLEPDNTPELKFHELTPPNDVSQLDLMFDELAAVKNRSEEQCARLALLAVLLEECDSCKPVSAIHLWDLAKQHLIKGVAERKPQGGPDYLVYLWRRGFVEALVEIHHLLLAQAEAELAAETSQP